jgi:hypothetical protein
MGAFAVPVLQLGLTRLSIFWSDHIFRLTKMEIENGKASSRKSWGCAARPRMNRAPDDSQSMQGRLFAITGAAGEWLVHLGGICANS